MTSEKVFLLDCAVQQYAWGKVGGTSAVAQLSQSGSDSFQLDPQAPYAELWMGTHPKGPSKLAGTGEELSSWVQKNPESLGSKVRERFPTPGQLPYLFKVLSVNKALSIQAHPNKPHAEELHSARPDKYPDPNHKPEMAIALTQFEGLCGFRPRQEIANFLTTIPEFHAVVGESVAGPFLSAEDDVSAEAALRQCFSALMNCDADTVKENLNKLVQRLNTAAAVGDSTESMLGDLVLRLSSQFPGDVGCFCAYLLNRMLLSPGEAMFLGANLPHAYLAGDCMECMACSDNVVRAGLTPKFKDVPTLCSMLDYSCKPASANLFTPEAHEKDGYVTMYNPPVPDFAVARVKLPSGKEVSQYSLEAVDSASILLVIEGEATTSGLDLRRGSVLFISANQPVLLERKSDQEILMFRAYCLL